MLSRDTLARRPEPASPTTRMPVLPTAISSLDQLLAARKSASCFGAGTVVFDFDAGFAGFGHAGCGHLGLGAGQADARRIQAQGGDVFGVYRLPLGAQDALSWSGTGAR